MTEGTRLAAAERASRGLAGMPAAAGPPAAEPERAGAARVDEDAAPRGARGSLGGAARTPTRR